MPEQKPTIYTLSMPRVVTQGLWRRACIITALKGLVHDGMIKIGPHKTLRPGRSVTLAARLFKTVEAPLRKAEKIGLVTITGSTSVTETLKEELKKEMREELVEALEEGKSLDEAIEEAVEDAVSEVIEEPEPTPEPEPEPEPEPAPTAKEPPKKKGGKKKK